MCPHDLVFMAYARREIRCVLSVSPSSNLVLGKLTPEELTQVLPLLTPVELQARNVLQEISTPVEHVYFLESGMVSLVVPLISGVELEVGTTGVTGLVNAAAALDDLPSIGRTFVQVSGTAQRIPLQQFKEVARSVPRLLTAARRQLTLLHAVAAQSAACNSQHEISERMARWLLHVQDETQSSHFSLTQEFMADMLGVRRPSVSTAAMSLQLDGAISYRRGNITIEDRDLLMSSACECYAAVRSLGGPADAM